MTYCIGMLLDEGIVLLSDSRTNAGVDQISMEEYEKKGTKEVPYSNTGEILPRHGRVLRPGVVDVAVLDPVENLRAEDLDGEVAALRDRFTAALNDWPGA